MQRSRRGDIQMEEKATQRVDECLIIQNQQSQNEKEILQ